MARKGQDNTGCGCNGTRHLVCRPLGERLALTPCTGCYQGRHQHVPLPAPPPMARVWDCGCAGRQHPVCDPRYQVVKDQQGLPQPVRFPKLKEAILAGTRITPHDSRWEARERYGRDKDGWVIGLTEGTCATCGSAGYVPSLDSYSRNPKPGGECLACFARRLRHHSATAAA